MAEELLLAGGGGGGSSGFEVPEATLNAFINLKEKDEENQLRSHLLRQATKDSLQSQGDQISNQLQAQIAAKNLNKSKNNLNLNYF